MLYFPKLRELLQSQLETSLLLSRLQEGSALNEMILCDHAYIGMERSCFCKHLIKDELSVAV